MTTVGTATKNLSYIYIQARGRQAVQAHNYIEEAQKQGVRLVEGSYTFRPRRYMPTLTALNLVFEGPARVIDALGTAIDEGLSDPL